MRVVVVLAVSGGAPPLVGCAHETASAEVLRIPVAIEAADGDVVFSAELADTPEERTRGLMFRASMEPEHGMLFLFPSARQNSFWMKNTYLSLDLIFIRSDRTILGIVENAEPRTTVRQSVPGASQFVLEINGGLSAKRGIRAGQRVRFTAPIPMSKVDPAGMRRVCGSARLVGLGARGRGAWRVPIRMSEVDPAGMRRVCGSARLVGVGA